MGNVSASETKGRTGEIKCQVAPRPGLRSCGKEMLGVPAWIFPRNSPPWESMGKVLVLLSTQLRLMPPAYAGFAFWMGAFVCGHYCIWQAVAVLTVGCEKVK